MAKLSEAEKLQKQAAGNQLWKEIQGNCTGPIGEFREELRDYIEINTWVRHHDDAQGRRADSNCEKAEAVLEAIAELDDDHLGYGVKYPRTPWEKCKPKFLTAREAAKHIESNYGPGYTSEPYVQLIEITESEKRVVCEYSQGAWLDPLVAAGFQS